MVPFLQDAMHDVDQHVQAHSMQKGPDDARSDYDVAHTTVCYATDFAHNSQQCCTEHCLA